jgi:beta-lactamase regulating signal transducer with metallopeptidase domain
VIAMLEILVGNTLVAAALAIVVFLLCRASRPSPAVRHALWLVVVVKLLSPTGLLWSVPLPLETPSLLENTQADAVPDVNRQAVPKIPATIVEPFDFAVLDADSLDLPLEVAPADLATVADATSPLSGEQAPEPAIAQPRPNDRARVENRNAIHIYWWLVTIWLAGALVVAGRYFCRTVRFSQYARSGKPASPSLQNQIAELAAAMGVRPPEVRVLVDLPSPVVWCLSRPVLLWPRGLQNQLSAGGRRAVLVHELAHLRRRDHWVRWLELAAAVVHWWNPLFWLARRQMRFHAELACDAWVTGTLPEIRRDYAEALLEVCARSSRAAAPSPAVGVGGEGRRDFQRRLTMIMREQVPCRLAAGAKLFVVLLLMAALPAWTLGQSKPEPKPDGKIEIKSIDVKDLNVIRFVDSGAVENLVAFGETDSDQKVREIEAKIAELMKQLEAVKARKSPPQPNQGLKFLFDKTADGKARILTIDGATGKIMESRRVETKAAPAPDMKPALADSLKAILGDKTIDGKLRILILDGQSGRIIESHDVGPQTAPIPGGKPTVGIGVIRSLGNPPHSKYKVIGPDGKEIKDAKVIVVEPQPAPTQPGGKIQGQPGAIRWRLESPEKAEPIGIKVETVPGNVYWRNIGVPSGDKATSGKVINLSRATYALPKEKASALAAFLKENVKASVMEIKIDESGLTVTTTPDAQTSITGIVKLIAPGQAPSGVFFYKTFIDAK